MESPAFRQLEKKLEFTFDLIEKLKDQTNIKELSQSRKDRELSEHKNREEALRQELTSLEKEKRATLQENSKKQKELRKRLEGMVTKLTLLEKSL